MCVPIFPAHSFDSQTPEAYQYVRPRDKRIINVVPSPKDAAEARATVAAFLVKSLKP